MDTKLARFDGRMVKKLCNFYATPNELYRLPVLGYKQEEPCASKEDNLPRMWHEMELVSGSCSSIQKVKFKTHLKMNVKQQAALNWKKWIEEKLRTRRNRSAWKNEKKALSAFPQDSSKSLEDKCVYTRLDVFIWISIVSIPQGIIKNLQSG